MNRRPVSDLLTELEGLGADQDHTDLRPGWWKKFWKSRDPPPSPAVELSAPPPRPEVKTEKPPPVPDEQLQALARNLEHSYTTIQTFQTEPYMNRGADPLLQKIKQLSSKMAILMPALRQGKTPYGMTLEKMQKDANEISTVQSNYQFGYHDFVFSEYMKSVQEVSSILYDHLHPHPTRTEEGNIPANGEEVDRLHRPPAYVPTPVSPAREDSVQDVAQPLLDPSENSRKLDAVS